MRNIEREVSQPGQSLSYRRMQKSLREALIDLIEERGFEALTVGEIIERALVSRSTFYRNYRDKYDLVEQIFAEAMGALFNTFSEPGTEHPPQIWVKFFEHIAEYERLYRALLGRQGSPWFVLKMRASLVELIKEYEHLPFWPSFAGQPLDPGADELARDLVSTMFVEAITWWLEHGRPYPPQDFARHCVLLAFAMFKETSTWQ